MIEGKVEDMEEEIKLNPFKEKPKKKTYKSWELLKEIAEGNIKSGTHIKVHCRTLNLDYWFWGNWFGKEDGYSKPIDNIELYLCDEMATFEIIEEQEEINIQCMEELKDDGIFSATIIQAKINEIIQSVKQLDKQVKENK